jgi:glycine/D-amino acid oxidase-like deaminating enzyme
VTRRPDDLGVPGDRRALSLWWDELGEPADGRPPLGGDLDVDVAVVGAGFTGLWTAHALLIADPALRIAVIEREVAGFGASGRNGGWCSALFAASDARLARQHGPAAARALRRALRGAVDEVGQSAASEGIDCDFAKGGTIVVARNRAQVTRARDELTVARVHGETEADLRWLDAESARAVVAMSSSLGATYTPHCAALQPARLARGLAEAVERRGGRICERTRALAVVPGAAGRRPRVETTRGRVRADVVVRALEGYTTTLRRHRRVLAPIYSLMIATEPLDEATWAEIGLARRETFADHRHLIIYGQRTAGGRLAFGGRGAPYHFGSAIRPAFDRHGAVHAALAASLVELFPALRGVRITHAWGGPLGIPRDWFPSVEFDPASGLASAGGYVGDGVSTTNLAGRTLADLILGRRSELVDLPWVGHRSPHWEPEPLRWLGVNGALAAMGLADRSEARRGRPSGLANRLGGFVGA